MVKKRTSSFRGKVGANAQRTTKAGASYGHLRLPKGVGVFTPEPDGRVKFDVIPYIVTDPKHPDHVATPECANVGEQWWRRPYKLHRNIGGSNDSAVCLTSIGKKCPICEYKAKRAAAGADKDELKALRAGDRILYNIIPLDNKKFEEKVHIFDIASFNFQNLLTEELKENVDYEVFPDLEEGLSLKVRFEAATVGTGKPYPEASRIDFVEREETYDESILDESPNLDEVLIIMSYAELEAKFLNDEEAKDEEEEDEPRHKKTTVAHKKKQIEEEEEEPEEEEEETPKRKAKPTRKPIKKDEEEEDEDALPFGDDKEEEEEKPKKKTAPTRKPVKKDEEEEEEEKDEKPTKHAPVKKKTSASEPKKLKCPSGLRFGIDAEDYDVCDTCDIWSECVAAKEARGK
jgi:hypothetical protein